MATSAGRAVSLPSISYVRAGGRTAPPDHERLEITSDGDFSLRRSVRSPAVGRFGGQLTAEEQLGLGDAARAALAAGPLTAKRVPDAAEETITIDGTTGSVGGTLRTDPWGALATRLRTLLVDLVRAPVAGVTVVVAPDLSEAHLSHVGVEALTLDLGRLAVTAVLLDPGGSEVGRWQSPPPPGARDAAPVVAEVGWSLALPFGHALVRQPGQTLQVTTSFGLVDGAERIAVLVTTVVR